MDPLSGLGAASSAAQLLAQGVQLARFLVELYTKSQAPEFIQKQMAQVEQLVDIARLVQKNSSLQKDDSIALILGSCTRTATDFLNFLGRYVVTDEDGTVKKIQKVFTAMLKEKEVTHFFDDLEREKSSLILCIQTIDSNLLLSVNLKVDEVMFGMGQISLVMHDTALKAKDAADTLPQISGNVADIQRNVESLVQFTLKRRPTARVVEPLTHPEPTIKNYYLVPSRRVRGFIGREDILTRIKTAFSDRDDTPRIVVIRAMGGQGKTQVALEYCFRTKENPFQAIFWADATSENTLKKSYETTAARIRDPSQAFDREAGVDYVLDKLAEWPQKWLLVLDNYDDPVSFSNLLDYIPSGEQGCILVTTRHADADALTDPYPENAVELPGLGALDALALLFRQSQIEETDANREEGIQIVDRLGYHPLAITQAGSYIRQRKIQLHEFTSHYKRQRKVILQQTPQMTMYRRKLNETDKETALSVFTTWELSFQQFQAREDTGDLELDILTLFAFFDYKEISEQIFKSFANSPKLPVKGAAGPGHSLRLLIDEKGAWNGDKFVSVLIDLTQASLLQTWSRDADGFCHFSLHPLVKDWILIRTEPQALKSYYIVAANIIAEFLRINWNYYDFKFSLPVLDLILSHIDAHMENKDFAKTEGIPSQFDDFSLLHESEIWFSRVLDRGGRAKEAKDLSGQVLEWRETVLGPDHDSTLEALDDRRYHIAEDEDYAEAITMDRRMIKGYEALHGRDCVESFKAYNCLFEDLIGNSEYEEAQKVCDEHLEAYKTLFGPDEPETGNSLHNQGWMCQLQGKYPEAEGFYRKSAELAMKTFGADHASTLLTLGNLAEVLNQQSKFEAERTLREDIAKSRNKSFGHHHPDTLFNQHEMGWVLYQQKKYAKAEAVFRDVVKQWTEILGREHSHTLGSFHVLAQVLMAQGKFQEAEAIWREQINIRKQTPDSEATDVAQHILRILQWLAQIGIILIQQERPREAEEVLRRTIDCWCQNRGNDDPEMLPYLKLLEQALEKQNKNFERVEVWKQIIRIQTKAFGPEHPDVFSSRKSLEAIPSEN